MRKALGGVSILLGCAGILAVSNPASAQSRIIPDETLGSEKSGIAPLDSSGLPIDVIDQGAIRGSNLFHSFQEFNVPELRGVYFRNPSNSIQNILARVTGKNRSEILGTLGIFNGTGVTSRPNLFLINPNGILFGQNASLDLPASFVATTANAIRFGETGFFSASAPETSNLLTIQPSALFFNQSSPQAAIVNQANLGLLPAAGFFIHDARTGLPTTILPDGSSVFFPPGLQVVDGQTIALVGGNIELDQSLLTAVGGRIEIGSVIAPGTVGLQIDSRGVAFNYDNVSRLGDVQLASAVVNASGDGGGAIQIQANRLLTTENNLFSGIAADTQGSRNGSGILIRATDSIRLENAVITGVVSLGAEGDGGDITIRTPTLVIDGGTSSILTRSFGLGQAGAIEIESKQLILSNGAAILASADGTSNAGNLTVRASDFIDVSGTAIAPNGEEVPGGLQTDIRGTGIGGTLTINTRRLTVREGAIVSARTDDGQAGNVVINATDSIDLFNGGDAIQTQTFGLGNAGTIKITTQELRIRQSGGISASAGFQSSGQAGNIDINAAKLIDINGTGGIITAVIGGSGAGGHIIIQTSQLKLRNGGTISAQAFTQSRGGTIDITATDEVEVIGQDQNIEGLIPGQITTQTSSLSNQPSGSLTIRTRKLSVLDGGQIAVDTIGDNPAGNLVIQASESVNIRGISSPFSLSGEREPSRLSATSIAQGKGGSIEIRTQRLNVSNDGEISVSSREQGQAGNIEIVADSVRLEERAKVIANAGSGNGGDIVLNLQNALVLRRNSQISTTAGTARAGGNGGNITINSPFLISAPLENSDIKANAFAGQGGQVNINAQGIYWLAPLNRAELEQRMSRINSALEIDPENLPTNDITAISQTNPNLSGQVSIDKPDIDPSRGLVALPTDVTDRSNQIAQRCTPRSHRTSNSFISIGRGGIPQSPTDALRTAPIQPDWIGLPPKQPTHLSTRSSEVQPDDSKEIVQIQGWVKDQNGDIYLVAHSPTVSAHPVSSISCP